MSNVTGGHTKHLSASLNPADHELIDRLRAAMYQSTGMLPSKSAIVSIGGSKPCRLSIDNTGEWMAK